MGLTTLLDTFRLLALTNKNNDWLLCFPPSCGQNMVIDYAVHSMHCAPMIQKLWMTTAPGQNLLEKFEFFKCLRITLEFIIERDSRETRVLFLGDRLIPF